MSLDTDHAVVAPGMPRAPLLTADVVTPLVVLAACVVLILGMKLVSPGFGSAQQIAAILVTSIFLIVAAFGQGLTILLGRGSIDLSIGVVISLGGMMISWLTNGANDTLWWALPLTLVCCGLIGFINGLGIMLLGIPPFIMTLASGTAFFGVALGLSAGGSQRPVAPALEQLMSGTIAGIPIPILMGLVFLVIAATYQNRSAQGRKLYAIGNSLRAARIAGLPITRLTIIVYTISACCAGIAGILLAGYSSSATLDMGDSFLLPSIAAVVIGGARVTGGKGLYLGTFAGAIFLSILSTIITVLSLSQGWRNMIEGGIIIIALILQTARVHVRRR